MPSKSPAPGPRPGRHTARHKAPSPLQRVRLHAGASLRSVPRPVAAVVAGALLTASAVAGSAVLAAEAAPAGDPDTASTAVSTPPLSYERDASVATRSAERPTLEELKAAALDVEGNQGRHEGRAVVTREELAGADDDPQDIALAMLAGYGWSESEFGCLQELWTNESSWDPYATNPTSGAYGIPQSLPAEKMASAGPDWETNPATQIEWGLTYIRDSYGSPCAANSFQLGNNWY